MARVRGTGGAAAPVVGGGREDGRAVAVPDRPVICGRTVPVEAVMVRARRLRRTAGVAGTRQVRELVAE